MLNKFRVLVNNKNNNYTIVLLFVCLLMVVGLSYAFFAAQTGVTTAQDVSVTSNTTDNLSFQINRDIAFRVTQADLAQGGNNKSGDATVIAVLTPNNKTGAGSMNYYMYLNLSENGIGYSSTNVAQQPELMVTVYDSNNQIVSLDGLGDQVTVKGVTGYDITGRLGLITLFDGHTITASNNQATTENLLVVVTLINLDVDQQDNTNKTVEGTVIVSKDQILDSPRLAITVPQEANGVTVGYSDTVIEPSINQDEEEIYTIYTVGYITNDSILGTIYNIDIQNINVDFTKYGLELVGSSEVMTTLGDYENYIEMKSSSIPVTSLSTGNTTSAVATANDLYSHSLGSNNLTINSVNISCNSKKCTAAINESFSNLSGISKHSTETNGGEQINVVYNGIKFNLKKVRVPDDNVEYFERHYNLITPGNVVLTNGYIYYHGEDLTNGANDGGYRYAGANPDNYVCYGSNATPCPAENLYRIIGLVPVDVVIDDTTNPVTTERQLLYKLIKNDYLASTEVSIGIGTYDSSSHPSPYTGPSGNQYVNDPQGYYWSGSSSNQSNTWSSSTLNTSGLNGSYLTNLESIWQRKIAKVIWKVGGGDWSYIGTTVPMSNVYKNEITESGQHVTFAPTDGNNEYAAKIGLIYVSDYGYAAIDTAWTYPLYESSYNDYRISTITAYNWLYRGINEWTISRWSANSNTAYRLHISGSLGGYSVFSYAYGVRPTFYLTKDTGIDMENYAGTKNNPFRTVCSECYSITVNSNNNVTAAEYAIPGDKVNVKSVDNSTYLIKSFKMNGQTINGNTFTMPNTNVVISDVVTENPLEVLRNNSNYKIIEYIESAGKQYIQTSIIPNNTTGVYMKVANYNTSDSKGKAIMGSMGSGSSRFYLEYYSSAYNFGWNTYGIINPRPAIVEYEMNEISINYLNSRKILYKNVDYDITDTLSANNTYPLAIFALHESGSITDYSHTRLYEMKISVGSDVLYYFVPVINNITGEAGLYDAINKVFYGNNGTEKFILPPNSLTEAQATAKLSELSNNNNFIIKNFINSDGSQYINTGVIPNANTNMEVDFEYYGTNWTGTSWTVICGVYSPTFAFWVQRNTLQLAPEYGSWDPGSNSNYPVVSLGERHTMYNRGRNFYLDGVLKDTATVDFGTTSNYIYLFAYGGTTSPSRTGIKLKVYSFKIYNNNQYVRYLVPVERASDHVLGMYDLVNDIFYKNDGTGTFGTN